MVVVGVVVVVGVGVAVAVGVVVGVGVGVAVAVAVVSKLKILTCAVCRHEWASRREPARCPAEGCRSKLWRGDAAKKRGPKVTK